MSAPDLRTVPQAERPHVAHVALPALDGLRGIAVLLVLIDHFSFPITERALVFKDFLQSGWIGVDLFFVLSGYLITRGLVRSSPRPAFERLKLFWMRRVLRIFPLYYLMLIVGSLVCLFAQAYSDIPGWTSWLFLQNYTLIFDEKMLRWTAHTWSLAIEEQFYFVWPLVMLYVRPRSRIPLAVALAIGSLALRMLMVLRPDAFAQQLPSLHEDHDASYLIARVVYRATPTHVTGILTGTLLAMLEAEPTHVLARAWSNWRGTVALLSTAALIAMVILTRGFVTEDRRVLILGVPILSAVFASWISLASDSQFSDSTMRALCNRNLVAVGKYSYAMYLIHWPLVALFYTPLLRVGESLPLPGAVALGLSMIVLGIGLAYAFGALSFKHFESRFATRKERFVDA